MKRRLLVLALSAALVPAGPSTAAPSSGQDRVVGGARDAFDANVSFSARSGPGGENPRGHINATVPFPGTPGDTLQFRLEVTCLAVAGGLAAAGAVVTESSANDVPPGTNFVVVFRDTGLPGGRGDAVAPVPGAPAATCASFLPVAALAPPNRTGNVQIHDTS
jgi:hypothetical protein